MQKKAVHLQKKLYTFPTETINKGLSNIGENTQMLKHIPVAIMATIFFGSVVACGDKEDDTAAVEDTAQDTSEAGDTGEEVQESK